MCLGTFPHRARSSVTVCAFARYAHPDTRNISFSLNRICSEGNCQVLYRAATGVGFFSYVSPIGSGIMNLFPAVLIEYTKYFVKRIYSMSSKTKIIVLRMKEIIYTALFIGFAIVLIMLFLFMFRPKKDNISGSTADQTAENHSCLRYIRSGTLFVPHRFGQRERQCGGHSRPYRDPLRISRAFE